MNDRNKNRPGYKETKVGWIPEEWGTKSGEEITALISKGASPRWQGFNYTTEGMLFITSENVRDGKLDISRPKFLPVEFNDKIKRTQLKKYDILINLVGASIGRSCLIPIDLSLANVNQAVAVFRLKDKRIASYMAVFFQMSDTVKRILDMQVDAARPNLSLSNLRDFKCPLPPILEQEAIVEVLGCWDEGLETIENLIEAKKLRKKGLMQQLLTGTRRLPGFSKDWKTVKLGDICTVVKKAVGEKKIIPMSLSAGKGFVAQADKFGRDISGKQYSKYTHLTKGCFTYNKGNSKTFPQGCAYLLEDYDEVAVPNVFISFKFDDGKADNKFFQQVFAANMHGKDLIKFINSGVRNDGLLNLNTTWFMRITFNLPTLKEQKAIAAVLETADEEIRLLEAERDALAEQKKGLMQKLLTGEVRLPAFRKKQPDKKRQDYSE
ncbi:MAG: restriction endonuclease subunit S [Kiritimatiellae bacterium]|nr:restriction endonuclease subunit S [Kiritimatiellia bacterium]MDD4734607.1 restriction endonuclease subunit S [Kiritimatiellia bacterium]